MGRKLSAWTLSLESKVDYERRQACEALGELGPAAKEAVPKLVLRLEDVNEGVAEFAAVALAKIGPDAVPALEAVLKRDEPKLRLYAAEALSTIDARHEAAGRELINAATGLGNAELAERGRGALVKLKAQAVPLVTPILSDHYAPVRLQAAKILGEVGPEAASAVDALAGLAKIDRDISVRKEAMRAMARIGPREKVAPILEAALNDPNGEISANAGALLLHIGARSSASGSEDESAQK
ncbi:MAG: HEAT repeat domain-containing protein [Deltaproteobacteria bacterium]|nr:HEAT repeat domain-containing protein [Deltaproteobacteria bacterium]